MGDVLIGVLGPLAVTVDGAVRTPQATKVQQLLTLLTLDLGSMVTTSAITDKLWHGGGPESGVAAIYVYVSQLRQQLNPGVPVRHPDQIVQTVKPGYRLAPDLVRSDLQRFRTLTAGSATALDAGDADHAARLLREALALWRGPALAGIETAGLLHEQAMALDEQRLAVNERLLDIELLRGNHVEALPDLSRLTRLFPLRERLAAQLMLALYRSGRQAEALTVYQRTRSTLADDLGVEPGPELREMQRAILAGDVAPPASPQRITVQREGRDDAGAPSQLPPTITDFTSRDGPLREVLGAITAEHDAPGCCEITGPGGAGKSTLAVHAAHQLRADFPDGQLFAPLRGSTEQPADPGDVLTTFLVSLGLDARFVPESEEERSRLLRTRLDGRRVLIVLDDAAAESQVRPLLPGSPSCAVLITARSSLLGLEGVDRVAVDMLTATEARSLLTRMVGARRTTAEAVATDEVAHLCGYLPLAVRIAGARLASRPHRAIADFAESLADERGRLDELVAGDLEVRASIGLSYRACNEVQRRLLGLISAARFDDFPAWVAAALIDAPLRRGTGVLEELVDAQLVQAVGRDPSGQVRYALHDLVRIYVDEHRAECFDGRFRAAVDRLLAVLVPLLAAAEEVVHPSGVTPPIRTPTPAVGLADELTARVLPRVRDHPLRWATGEFRLLTRAVELAHDAGLWSSTVTLVDLLTWLLDLRSDWAAWATAQRLGMDAAVRSGDRRVHAMMLHRQGDLEWDLGRAGAAVAAYTRAACLFRRLGDRRATARVMLGLSSVYTDRGPLTRASALLVGIAPVFEECADHRGQAMVLRYLGLLDRDQGRLDSAARSLLRSADIFGDLGDRRWRTYVLRGLIGVRRLQGRLGEATWIAQECLGVVRELGDRRWEAFVLSSLADVDVERRQWQSAQSRLGECLEMFGAVGDQRAVAFTLHSLGNLQCEQNRPDQAIDLLRRALAAFEELGDNRGRAITSLALGRAHQAAGRPDEALEWFDRSATLCEQVGLATREREALDGRREAGLAAARLRTSDAHRNEA